MAKADGLLKIVVHDYSGHPGQVQLSRTLASRGHSVAYQHCPSYVSGRGAVKHLPDDPMNLRFEPFPLNSDFNRYSVWHRFFQEIQYGIKVGRHTAREVPDVMIISNVPLLAHAVLAMNLRLRHIPMIFWQQDIYSSAIGAAARRKFPIFGSAIAWAADRIERLIAKSSTAVVAISPVFLDKLDVWGVAHKTTVIPNWAPIDELPVRARQNAWSDRMGLSKMPVVMYSGTLGLKHDPSILALIAKGLGESNPDARVVVVSEGLGRKWLEQWRLDNSADNLILLDFQSYEDLPMMLASADILVAVLEPDASKYSVPSKVLTYLCSGRAILGIIPYDNSVAEVLWGNEVGLVADPAEREKLHEAISELLADETHRHQLGQAAREYAEREFRVDRAANQFEAIFRRHDLLISGQ